MRNIGGLSLVAAAILGGAIAASAQTVDVPKIVPLTAANGPVPAQTEGIIVDPTAAAQLGKALFWDVAAGSDGNACASCHFAAGADLRTMNQVNPGGEFDDLRQFVQDKFSPRKSNGAPFGVNASAVASDFPFHVLANPLDRNSAILYATNDVFSSSGTFAGAFTSTAIERDAYGRSVWSGLLGGLTEACRLTYDTANPFHQTVGGKQLIHRRVEPRNTPTVINAVFNIRQFWDGRANNVFNGVNPFGARGNADPSTGILVPGTTPNSLVLQKLALRNSSLASQAVGPPLSSAEMSCENRTFADIGRKMLPLRPLAAQAVHYSDSVFSVRRAPYAALVTLPYQKGLATNYEALIKRAFNAKYWNVPGAYRVVDGQVVADATGYRQMELNFSLFWGLALQQYQSLLISEQTPFDQNRLSASAKRGMAVFTGQGSCVNCHSGPLFSNATQFKGRTPEIVERMAMGDGGVALYDEGFYNIGVRPTRNDLGVGGTDPFGNPLSFARQAVDLLQGRTAPDAAQFDGVDPCRLEVPFNKDILPGQPCWALPGGQQAADLRVAVDGAMKTPTLRNIALTPPYMHNGGLATLNQVVEFYNRGGNRRDVACSGRGGPKGDTTGFGATCSNLDADIKPLNLTAAQQNDLIEFMKALTDNRVACHQAPFDHPSLTVSVGHYYIAALKSGDRAPDLTKTLPATGRSGLTAEGRPCFPNNGDLFGTTQTTINRIVR